MKIIIKKMHCSCSKSYSRASRGFGNRKSDGVRLAID